MDKKITDLKLQKRNKNRMNVYLDDEFAFGISRIVGAWLRIGITISQKKIDELQQEDAVEVALQKAINFLSYRPRSEAEVIKNLKKHETPDFATEIVLQRLRDNRLLNDIEFAKTWVENRSTFRPRGAYLLRQELRQKGLSDEAIEGAVQSLDENELAYEAGKKKAIQFKNLEFLEFKKKLYGFLSRRGFNYEVISSAVNTLWDEIQTD
jgi:regulatory protein